MFWHIFLLIFCFQAALRYTTFCSTLSGIHARQCAVISHIGLRIGGAMMVWMEICVDGGRLERLDTGSSGGLLMRIMQDKIAI